MGSSEGGGLGVLDSRIGSIVWVRRRNGSWWPGKILGTDELSASHLMSPRSGTPVKLLGREDASVDWYNLEKSKRVKTFRCGEFDDCIERAEASLGLPAKKREKYARREDAILHALELEKEIIEKNSGNDLHTTFGDVRNGNGRLQNMESQVVSPIEECNMNLVSTQKGEGGVWQNLVNPISNTSVGGSRDSILSRKIVSAVSSPSRKATGDDQAQAVTAGTVCGDVDSGNSTDKGKGLLDMSIEESGIKIYDRRRPLVHVLQNSSTWPDHSLQTEGDAFSMLGVNNQGADAQMKMCRLLYLQSQVTDIMDIKGDQFGEMETLGPHQGVGIHSHTDAFQKDVTSGSSEDTESDSSDTEQYNNVGAIRYSDVHTPMELQLSALNGLEQQGNHGSSSSEKSDKSFPQDVSSFQQKGPVSLDLGVSRWQMKGKRNARSFSRRSVHHFTCGTYLEPRSLLQRPTRNLSHYQGHDGFNNEADFNENDPEPFIGGGYGRGSHLGKSQAASRRWNSPGSNMADLEELKWRDSSFGGYWGDGFGGSHAQEVLLDVNLKVQAINRREHVPFVSLMSRLNGKPIIGHPIQIETLGDGATDALLSSVDAFEHFESDNANRVPPAWTTSRRTSKFRAPHPHLSQLDDVDNHTVDEPQKSHFGKPVAAKKKNLARRISHQTPKLPSSEKMNPPKRSSSSSSQKIRPLSSLGMNQKPVSEPRRIGLKRYMDGAIKSLDSGPPTVACIPVKLVFSRLLEAIGRPGSMPSSHKGFSEQQ